MKNIILEITNELEFSFKEVDFCFELENYFLEYQPTNKGWTIKQILEHISLTNYYLLILVKKGVEKSLALARKDNAVFGWGNYEFDLEKLNTIGDYNSFVWNRPNHMEPSNKVALIEVRNKLKNQLEQCLNFLAQIKNGEGILYKTMMSVNGLGKIDVYHYIYFIVQHNRRHLQQIGKIKKEFYNENNNTRNT